VPLAWRFDRGLFMQGIGFALRAHALMVLGILMARTAPLILRGADAFGDLGQWSIAAQISDALLLLPATVSLLLFPSLVRAEGQARWAEFRGTALRVGALMAVVCVAAALIAAPAIVLVFGPAYAPAVGITLALLPGVFLLSLASVVSQFLAALGIPAMQIAGWIVGWIVQIVLSLVWFAHYGVLGLAAAQSASWGLVCLWLLAGAMRYAPGK
jgi:O-antigen/teichoic acid export membrane protein